MGNNQYCVIKTKNSEEWHATRGRGIGGSDAGALMGVNPYRTPLAVYLDKIGELPRRPQTAATYFGTRLESFVADEFAERHKDELKVRVMRPTLYLIEHPFIRGNLDRVVTVCDTGQKVGLEIKTANAFAIDDWYSEEGEPTVPASYWVQVQHYMLVTGWSQFYVAALIGGQTYLERIVPRNENFISELRTEEVRFWNENVVPRIQPEWDGSKIASEYLKQKYPTSTKGKEITLTDNGVEAAENYIALNNEISALEKMVARKKEEREIYKQQIAAMLQDAETATGGGYTIKYSTINIKEKTTAAYSYRRMTVKGE